MRDTLSRIKNISNCTRDYTLYNVLKNDYKSQIAESKKIAYDNYINKSDNKVRDSWKLINFEINKSSKCSPEYDISSDSFNTYFSSIAEQLIDLLPTVDASATDHLKNLPSVKSSFFLEPVTPNEVREAVNSLKNSSCTDVYGLNSLILKDTVDIIDT